MSVHKEVKILPNTVATIVNLGCKRHWKNVARQQL
jgi:hypothetical protein